MMATRIPVDDPTLSPTPDPKALAELRQLVDALPDDIADWTYTNSTGNVVPVPAVMAFLERVGLSVYLGAISVWPGRVEFWKWLTSPCPSLAGLGGEPSTYEPYRPYLASRQEGS